MESIPVITTIKHYQDLIYEVRGTKKPIKVKVKMSDNPRP